jgi:hypothetical protein
MRPPLNSTAFNMREIAKQLILLEDHLNDEEKYCVDCIRKHFLNVEALAEEAISLDDDKGEWRSYNQTLARKVRGWIIKFSDSDKARFNVSKQVRLTRKGLVEAVYDPRYDGKR